MQVENAKAPEALAPAPEGAPAAASRRRSLKDHTQVLAKAQVGTVAGLAAGLLLFYLLGHAPAQKRQAALKSQIAMKQRELDSSREQVKCLPQLHLDVRQLERTVEKYDRQFPRQLELGQFIKDLTRLCQQSSLQEWKYQPGAPKRTDTLQEMPILMHFNGDFVSAAMFIQQIEDLPRLTRVKRLRVRQREARAGAVEVEASVSIYFAEGR